VCVCVCVVHTHTHIHTHTHTHTHTCIHERERARERERERECVCTYVDLYVYHRPGPGDGDLPVSLPSARTALYPGHAPSIPHTHTNVSTHTVTALYAQHTGHPARGWVSGRAPLEAIARIKWSVPWWNPDVTERT